MTITPKRIGFFLPSLQPGGTERAFVNLAIDFSTSGYKVDFLLKQEKGEFLHEIPPQIEVTNLNATRMIATFPGLVRYIRSGKTAALISGLELPNIILLLSRILSRRNPKIIISIRSVTSKQGRYFLPTRSLERWLMRSLYPRADHIIAVSNSAAQDCAVALGIDINLLKVIYNPVLTPQFFYKLDEKLEHPWFLPRQPPVILGVGRLNQVKDFETLVRAFLHVQEWIPSRLLILGEGPQRAEIELLVSQLGLNHSVQLAGFVPNPYPYFKNAAVFVSSSVYDASPNVLVEAMASGCPVVSTACPGGAAELIGNGKYGHLTPVGDDQAMAYAIEKVFNGDKRPASTEWLSNFTSQTALNHYRQLVEGK